MWCDRQPSDYSRHGPDRLRLSVWKFLARRSCDQCHTSVLAPVAVTGAPNARFWTLRFSGTERPVDLGRCQNVIMWIANFGGELAWKVGGGPEEAPQLFARACPVRGNDAALFVPEGSAARAGRGPERLHRELRAQHARNLHEFLISSGADSRIRYAHDYVRRFRPKCDRKY